MTEAAISVIIPAYNSEAYIADCVRSVLAQTLSPAEIIVVDDGSTDGTARALEPFRNTIRYIYQPNQGEPAARNTGMRNSSGEYIAFLDADDLWLPDKLERQMAYLRAYPGCAMVYTDMSTFDQHGTVDASVKVRFNITFPTGNIFRPLFRETLFGSGSVLFRRSCLDRAGYFDESLRIGSDYDMWLRIARHFEVGVVDSPLLRYRQHPEMSTRGLGRVLQNGVPWEAMVLKKILRLYPEAVEELGKSAVKQRLSQPYAKLAHKYLQQGDHKSARTLFRGAIDYCPADLSYWFFYLACFLSPPKMARLRRFHRRWFASHVAKPAGASRAELASGQ